MDNMEQKKLHKNANRKVTVTLKKADYEEENTSEVKSEDITVVEMSDNQKTISGNNELLEYLKSIIGLEIAIKHNNQELKDFHKIPEEKIDYKPPIKPGNKPIITKNAVRPPKKKPSVIEIMFKAILLDVALNLFLAFVFLFLDGLGDEPHIFFSIFFVIGFIIIFPSYLSDERNIYNSDKKRYEVECEAENVRYQKLCENSLQQYNKELKEYEANYAKYQQEYEELVKNNQERRNLKLEELNNKAQQMSAELADLYSKNILHVRYRNIEAVTAIYDYISTGRCQTLEGRDGAYNLYEEEKTKQKNDEQIKELEAVISNLQKDLENERALNYSRMQHESFMRSMDNFELRMALREGIHDLNMNIDNYL